MSGKRHYIDLDPDYEDVSQQQSKRQRVLEQDAKEATVSKIQDIIKKEFAVEITNKEQEVLNISEKLERSRCIIDRLRACIVASYYGNTTQQKCTKKQMNNQLPMIHPTVKNYIGKSPRQHTDVTSSDQVQIKGENHCVENGEVPEKQTETELVGKMAFKQPNQDASVAMASKIPKEAVVDSRTGRFKVKKRIIVGNVSKNIPAERRDENDQASHKWMVYVRGSKEEPRIDHFVKKVWFFLHPSYRPNDLVEVSQHPFHLTRRGWGEFPVRVQLHFKDSRNKRIDIIHNLKLDRTYTGLQTLGAETVVDIELERDLEELRKEKMVAMATSIKLEPGTAGNSFRGGITVKEENSSGASTVKVKMHGKKGQNGPHKSVMPVIKTEPLDLDYGDSVSITQGQGHYNDSRSEKVSINSNNKENSTTDRQKSKASDPLSVTLDGQGSVPLIQNFKGAFPLMKADGSIVLAVSASGSKKTDSVKGNSGIKLVPAQNMVGTVKQSVAPGSQNVQLVLKGLGSLGTTQLGGSLGAAGVALAPVTAVPVHTTQTPTKPNKSQSSVPKTSPNVTKAMLSPPSNMLVLRGLGSITGPNANQNSPTTSSVVSVSGSMSPVASVTNQSFSGKQTSTTSTSTVPPNITNLTDSNEAHILGASPQKFHSGTVTAGNQPVTPPKQCKTSCSPVSRPTSSPGPILLQGLGSISALNSISSSATVTSSTKSGLVTQTGLQTLPLLNAVTASKTGTQSNQSGLVFLKCTDNQGKTYLIPQQLYSGTSLPQDKMKGGNPTSEMRGTTQNPMPSLLLSPQKVQTAGKLSGNVQTAGKPTTVTKGSESSVAPLLNVNLNQVTNLTGLQNKVPGQQPINAPIIFIKPEAGSVVSGQTGSHTNTANQTLLTGMKKQEPVNSGMVRLVSPAQIHNANTLKKTVNTGSSLSDKSNVRGQLKVTSQGLINIVKQNLVSSNIVTGTTSTKPVNGDIGNLGNAKQPLIIIPTSKQVSLLPGKSQAATASLLKGQAATKDIISKSNSESTDAVLSLSSEVVSLSTGKATMVQSNGCQSDLSTIPSGFSMTSSQGQLVIIPVSSTATSITKATIDRTSSVTRSSSSVFTSSQISSTSTTNSVQDSKTMYIVVQGEKSQGEGEGQLVAKGHEQQQSVSLLKPVPTVTKHQNTTGMCISSTVPVGSASSGEITQPVLLLNKADNSSRADSGTSVFKSSLSKSLLRPYRGEPEKKIIKLGPKKPKGKESDSRQRIPPLRIDEHCSLLSLMQAAIKSHPVVSSDAATHLHPYCAKTVEDWLTWNVGKRRASEWQRASSVRKFILHHIGGSTSFQGEQLWSTKKIMIWCRQHAYSPHYLEKPLHPTAIDLQAEHSLPTDKHRKYKSVSCADRILSDILESPTTRFVVDSGSDDEVEIVALESPKTKVKVEPAEEEEVFVQEYLPASGQARFIQDTVKQMGMKFGPVEVQDGYYGNISEDLIYRAMQSFMCDILRETFSLKVNMGRYPDGLGIADVYSALGSLSMTDFITNKYLGVAEDQNVPTAYR